jgi:integrase
MGVFIRRTAGGIAPYWFGLWNEDGKRHETSLCRWEGTPPAPGEKEGDKAFERSRAKAQQLFKRIREGEKSREEEKAIEKKILAARYGGRVARVKLADLAARWDALPHKADLTEERRARVHAVLARFVAFMADRFPTVKEAGGLTADHFKGFLADVDADGVSARTWNDYLSILRGVLAKVDGQGRGFREYLVALPKRTENTVHRRPFDGAELDAIFAAAADADPELRPVLVAAACTALRRGDVCRLRWDAVDMAEGFVTVKTSKTGETVEIPIFPPFRAVLEDAAARRKKGVPYVWPKIALAYARNADGLNWRLNRVLAAAGFAVPKRDAKPAGDKAKGQGNAGKYEAPEDAEAAAAMLEDGMEREGWTAKRKDKARRILALHFEGRNGVEIAAEIGTGKGAVSDYLHAMEDAGKMALVSEPKRDTPARATLAEIGEDEQRARRGSLCGWHSFRTTFCTLALANGVPMDLLRKITGHRTAEIVLKHYDRRGRDAMRRAIGDAMPKAIAGAVAAPAVAADGDALEAVALPASLAGMLADADPATLAKVARMLAKGKGGRK